MKNWREPFVGKRITVMGLGLLGRGIADVRFLHEAGAILTVTDLKTADELAPALEALHDCTGIIYVLGEHHFEDFENADYILKAAGVSLNSPYILHAQQKGVPIKMDESWTAELAPRGVTFLGVTGTRGKSTATLLIHHALNMAGVSVYMGGNVPNAAMLPLLKELTDGDTVVMELSSWQLQGWHDAGISPQIAVFTNFMEDHLNYYASDMDVYFADKAAIFSHQRSDDVLIISPDTETAIERHWRGDIESAVILAEPDDVPHRWHLKVPGEHYLQTAALALRALETLGLSEETLKKGIESFGGAPGRLELIGTMRGAPVYNDNHATTPAATRAGLNAVGGKNNVVLIMGGTGKGLSFEALYPVIAAHCKHVVLLDEIGSRSIRTELEATGIPVRVCDSPQACANMAAEMLSSDDVLLYSPAFASFGKHFKNEYDRGRQFGAALKKHLSDPS